MRRRTYILTKGRKTNAPGAWEGGRLGRTRGNRGREGGLGTYSKKNEEEKQEECLRRKYN